jgi:hypothetical protein
VGLNESRALNHVQGELTSSGLKRAILSIKDDQDMGLTSSIQNVESPHFYFELGELIANAGHDRFAENMLHLVDKLVPINRVELT